MSIAEALGDHMIEVIKNHEYKKIKARLKKENVDNQSCVKDILANDYKFDEPYKWINKTLYNNIQSIPIILRSASLVHDLGNPPYGHISEKTISNWFKNNLHKLKFNKNEFRLDKMVLNMSESMDKGTVFLTDFLGKDLCEDFLFFDGNAELLRIIRKLQNVSPNRIDHPVNLSYPLIATTLKYPKGFLEKRYPNESDKWNKKNYFTSEDQYYNDIQIKLKLNHYRHPLAFLLEAADDIAYLISDIEDASFKGLINIRNIRDVIKHSNISDIQNLIDSGFINQSEVTEFSTIIGKNKGIAALVSAIDTFIKVESDHVAIKKTCGRLRGFLISRVKMEIELQYDSIMKGKYYGNMLETSSAQFLIFIIKKLLKKHVYYSNEIIQKKIEGINAINKMLDSFIPSVVNAFDMKPDDSNDFINSRLISINFMELCQARLKNVTDDRIKIYEMLFLVVDYISGMTDSFASRIYYTLN